MIFLISLHSLQDQVHSLKQKFWVYQVWWYMIDWFDLPQLTTLSLGFSSITSFSLSSMMIYDCLIWSSSTHYVVFRFFINNKFEFEWYDEWWLIDLIFLISLHSLQENIHSLKQQVWVYQVWWYLIAWFDLPKLTTFTTGDYSFYKTTILRLSSMVIYDWLIWSS